MKKSRTEIKRVSKLADWGAYVLIFLFVITGILAYNYECIGDRWTKVLEIVGSPFALGMGFFAFKKGFEELDEYKKNTKEEEE